MYKCAFNDSFSPSNHILNLISTPTLYSGSGFELWPGEQLS